MMYKYNVSKGNEIACLALSKINVTYTIYLRIYVSEHILLKSDTVKCYICLFNSLITFGHACKITNNGCFMM